MKKYVKTVLYVLIALIIAAAAILLSFMQRVSMNPDGTVGNTAGNLNNEGLFCDYDGTVYFYNSFRKADSSP